MSGGSHSTPLDAHKNQTAANVDSVSAEHTGFHARAPRDHPLTTSGHQPGSKHSPLDSIPTFHAQTLPPGSAPKEKTYEPQNIESWAGGTGDFTESWKDNLPGADSKQLNQSSGQPGSGMSSQEMRHGGHKGGKRERLGVEAKYGSEHRGDKGTGTQQVDTSLDPSQRGLDRD